MKRSLIAIASLAALVAVPAISLAGGSKTSNAIQVSANVASNCNVTADSVAFGAYDPIGANASTGSDLANTGSPAVRVLCTKGTTATVTLNAIPSPGLQLVGANSGDKLAYTLSLTAPSSTTSTGVKNEMDWAIGGLIAKGQDVSVDSYSDKTAVANVSYTP